MRVYVTKYALTTGIETVDVSPGGDDPKYVYTKMGLGFQQFVMGRDAFHEYGDAAVAARAMRDKREESLKRQTKKLSCLIFPTEMPERLQTTSDPSSSDE